MLRDQAFQLVLSERGTAVLPVADGDTSMRPLLAGGDLVLASPLRDDPRPGDLLIVLQHDYLVVHRYLGPARAPDGRACLRTRGDGHNELDPPVLPDAVRGRVVAVRRAGVWRSLEGGAASACARLVAWHDHFWATLGVAGRAIGVGGLAARIDRGLLLLGIPFVFAVFHRRIEPPDAAVTDATV